MDFYKVVTANDRKSFEKQLNEAHEAVSYTHLDVYKRQENHPRGF